MYLSISNVVPQEDFTLLITFENGERGILDIKPYLDFGIFGKLKDYELFRRVHVSFDTVAWDCGADLDPEFINRKAEKLVS